MNEGMSGGMSGGLSGGRREFVCEGISGGVKE